MSEIFWHIVPGQKAGESGYYLFRKTFTAADGETFKFIVSADNRYNLYLDAVEIGRGPCRSDLQHYFYEEYCITPGAGTHVLALEVVVWQGGWRSSAAPWGEIHAGGGVLLDGDLAMPDGWKCCKDTGRRSLEWQESWGIPAAVPVPPMDMVDFNTYDHKWNRAGFDDSLWSAPVPLGAAYFRKDGMPDMATPWLLEKRKIAGMVSERSDGISYPEIIPAGKQRIMIDLHRNQTSMLKLCGRGGAGKLRIYYHEVWNKNPDYAVAYSDLLILPSGSEWVYRTFHFRTARWLEVVTELEEDCRIDCLEVDFVTYDFGEWKKYSNPDEPLLEKIYDVGVHTARCCAHDCYEDCPYYEQQQYGGDTRIQALISYEATGHGLLGRRWLEAFDDSRIACGLTQSRYPSVFQQVIPGFSLIWVLGVADYLRYFPDSEFARVRSTGIKAVLDYFEGLRRSDGLIGTTEFWNFTDWTVDWPVGCSGRNSGQPETILNLFYAAACTAAAFVTGDTSYNARAAATVKAVRKYCWDDRKQLLRDVPGEEWFSVHANTLGILTGCVDDARAVAEKILNDKNLTPCSLYFDFYVLEAMRMCGHAEGFRQVLMHWEPFISRGETTFPEIPAPDSRSHCHAWSAGPVYHLLRGFPGNEG